MCTCTKFLSTRCNHVYTVFYTSERRMHVGYWFCVYTLLTHEFTEFHVSGPIRWLSFTQIPTMASILRLVLRFYLIPTFHSSVFDSRSLPLCRSVPSNVFHSLTIHNFCPTPFSSVSLSPVCFSICPSLHPLIYLSLPFFPSLRCRCLTVTLSSYGCCSILI